MSKELFLKYADKIEEIGLSNRPDGPFDVSSFQKIRETIKNDLIPQFEEIVLSFLSSYSKKKQRLPRYNLGQIVSTITYEYNGYKKKVKDINYYKYNALAFISVVTSLLKNINKKEQKYQLTEDCIREQWYLLSEMFLYSCVFIRDICNYINEPVKFPIYWGARIENLIKTSLITKDILYGCCFPKSFEHTKYTVAFATIRLMIEVKVRRALGIRGIKAEGNSIKQLPFSRILKNITTYHEHGDILFTIPLEKIKNIYSMSNLYLHAGIRSYPWYPYIFYECIKPVIQPNEWDLRAGIKIRRSALPNILNDIAGTDKLDCITDENYLAATFFD